MRSSCLSRVGFVATLTLYAAVVGCGGGSGSGREEPPQAGTSPPPTTPPPAPPPENPPPNPPPGEPPPGPGPASPPLAKIDATPSAYGYSTVELDGGGSTDDGTITSYQWTRLSGPNLTITSPTEALAHFVAPQVQSGTTVRIQLTVTDDEGASNTAHTDIALVPAAAAQTDIQFVSVNYLDAGAPDQHSDFFVTNDCATPGETRRVLVRLSGAIAEVAFELQSTTGARIAELSLERISANSSTIMVFAGEMRVPAQSFKLSATGLARNQQRFSRSYGGLCIQGDLSLELTPSLVMIAPGTPANTVLRITNMGPNRTLHISYSSPSSVEARNVPDSIAVTQNSSVETPLTFALPEAVAGERVEIKTLAIDEASGIQIGQRTLSVVLSE